jgi:hypothetical protein
MFNWIGKIAAIFSPPMPDASSIVPQPTVRKSREIIRRNIFVVKLLLAIVLALIAIWTTGTWYYFAALIRSPELVAVAIGGLVGGVELLGRYRYAPLRAVFTLSGFIYILINMMSAWAAYYMISEFKVLENSTVAKELTHVLLAGFGSLVFMRSSFFKVRVGDSDIGIGP